MAWRHIIKKEDLEIIWHPADHDEPTTDWLKSLKVGDKIDIKGKSFDHFQIGTIMKIPIDDDMIFMIKYDASDKIEEFNMLEFNTKDDTDDSDSDSSGSYYWPYRYRYSRTPTPKLRYLIHL